MGLATGIGGQAGCAVETTYGTYVAPTRFLPVTKAPFTKVKNTVQLSWLGAGRLGNLGAARVVTTHAGKGSIEMGVYNHGMGILLQALMGTTVTPVQQGGTTAYLQTHTIADVVGKSLTMQVGVPDTTGTVRPYTFLGSKITDAEFTIETAKELTAKFNFDCRDVTEAQTLVAASYSANMRPFVGTDTGIKVGVFGSEAAVLGVRKVDLKIDRALKTDRYYVQAGASAGLKAEPLIGDFWKITGTVTADNVDKTIWADRFAADSGFSLVLETIGLAIGVSGSNDTFRITLPQCFLDGDTPTLDGPDIVSGAFPFTATFDATNLPKIEYMSSDTTV
jgi:hypothetical protein